jgi:iron complex transport system permease protein
MPRMTLAMLIGIGLALSGAIMQSISRNGLADPGLLGINAGAGVGVIGLLLFVGRDMTGANENPLQAAPFLLFPVVAFGGAFLAALLVYVLAYKNGEVTPSRLILVGVAVGFGLAAITLLLSLKLHPWIYQIAVLWLAGSITITTWKSVLTLLPWIVVLAPFVFYKARVLNVLNLGDSVATGLGTAVERQRLVLLAAAVGLAASSVAVGGGIAFVGLLGPHIARRLVGPRHEVMLPTAALVGALLLVIADIPARNLLAPIEIPTGIVVAIIGVPYFLYLLVRTA